MVIDTEDGPMLDAQTIQVLARVHQGMGFELWGKAETVEVERSGRYGEASKRRLNSVGPRLPRKLHHH